MRRSELTADGSSLAARTSQLTADSSQPTARTNPVLVWLLAVGCWLRPLLECFRALRRTYLILSGPICYPFRHDRCGARDTPSRCPSSHRDGCRASPGHRGGLPPHRRPPTLDPGGLPSRAGLRPPPHRVGGAALLDGSLRPGCRRRPPPADRGRQIGAPPPRTAPSRGARRRG